MTRYFYECQASNCRADALHKCSCSQFLCEHHSQRHLSEEGTDHQLSNILLDLDHRQLALINDIHSVLTTRMEKAKKESEEQIKEIENRFILRRGDISNMLDEIDSLHPEIMGKGRIPLISPNEFTARLAEFLQRNQIDSDNLTQFLSSQMQSKIQVLIKIETGKSITFSLESFNIVEDIKKKIEDKEGISIIKQRLIFEKKELNNRNTLADLKIQNSSTLYLTVKKQIYVKTSKRKAISLLADDTDTIADIKKKIKDQKGIPSYQQHLEFKKRELEDKMTLADYKIKNNSILKLKKDIQIFVKTIKGTIALDVKYSDNIQSLRRRIQEKIKIPDYKQRLFFNDKLLEDGKTLTDYKILNESTLYSLLIPRIEIFVEKLTGETISLSVDHSDTIKNIKAKIQENEGIPTYKQYIFSAGKQLEDERTIADYEIRDQSTLYLILRPIIQIFIRTQTEKNIRILADSSVAIRDVKTHIQAIEGIPFYDQHLIFEGRQLEDEKSLANSNIQDQSTIHLIHGMQIFLETPTGKTMNILVNSSYTIGNIKTIVQHNERIPSHQQRLFFEGKQLEDEGTLADYNINNQSTLQLLLRPAMQITVKALTGRTIATLSVVSSNTIEHLKTRIQDSERIPIQEQNLIFAYNRLEDGRKLADYDIRDQSTLQLLLRSGMQIFVKIYHGDTIKLFANSIDTIENLKTKILDNEGISPDEQRVFFKKMELKDERTLDYYHIKDESTLHLLVMHGCREYSWIESDFINNS